MKIYWAYGHGMNIWSAVRGMCLSLSTRKYFLVHRDQYVSVSLINQSILWVLCMKFTQWDWLSGRLSAYFIFKTARGIRLKFVYSKMCRAYLTLFISVRYLKAFNNVEIFTVVTVQIIVLFLNAYVSEELYVSTSMVEVRNVGFETQDYTESQPRKPQSGYDSILDVKPKSKLRVC
jgi:hypothetical protein